MEKELDRAVSTLSHEYLKLYPSEAVNTLSRMPPKESAQVMEVRPLHEAVVIWEKLPPDYAADVILHLTSSLCRHLLSNADPVANARVLARLHADRRDALINTLDGLKKRELSELIQYPESSAGSLMNTRFPVINEYLSVRNALQLLRRKKPDFTRHLFLVDNEGILKSMIEVQDLALAAGGAPLTAIAKPVTTAVLPTASREEVVEQLEKYKLAELPVVDVSGKLTGVISYNALVTAVREEASADIMAMVGVSRNERALSGIGFVVRKRLPWLELNLVTAFIAASVVGLFEDTIARFTALAVLLPVVAGQSGNTGAQALAVTMRGLALHEIGTGHWRRVAAKEIGAGLINGIAIALTTSAGVFIWSRSAGLSLVIGLSMIISMAAAGLSGVIIPVILSAAGHDPAQSSSIILTTITDVVGFLTFLGIATALAGML